VASRRRHGTHSPGADPAGDQASSPGGRVRHRERAVAAAAGRLRAQAVADVREDVVDLLTDDLQDDDHDSLPPGCGSGFRPRLGERRRFAEWQKPGR